MKEVEVLSSDGYKLCVHVFEVKNAKACVQIIHGMEEHQERYEKLASILNKAGFCVVSSDMRGHGKSVKKEDLGFFKDKKGYIALIEDQKAVTRLIQEKFAELPIYIFAHSMGTIITRVLLQENSQDYHKVILSGYPNYRSGAGLGIFLSDVAKIVFGKKYKSRLIQKLGVGVFNNSVKNPKTEVDWVCANEDTVQAYIADPYCGIGFTCSAFSDLFHLVKIMHKWQKYKFVNKGMEILMLRGEDDACTGGEKGAAASREVLKKAGFEKISYIDYPNMRHEIINEKNNEKVFADILKFFDEEVLKSENDKKQNKSENAKKQTNKKIAESKQAKKKEVESFKKRYFEAYDDIKSHTHDVYDW